MTFCNTCSQTSQMSGEKDLSLQTMCFFKLSRGIQLIDLENIICKHSPCCVRFSTINIPSQIVDSEGIMLRTYNHVVTLPQLSFCFQHQL